MWWKNFRWTSSLLTRTPSTDQTKHRSLSQGNKTWLNMAKVREGCWIERMSSRSSFSASYSLLSSLQEVSWHDFVETWYHYATEISHNTIKSFSEYWSGPCRTLWVQNYQGRVQKSILGLVYLGSITISLPWFGKEHQNWYLQVMAERVHCKKRKSKTDDKWYCKNFQSNSEMAERLSAECW